MKESIRLGAAVVLVGVLCSGCATFHSNTAPRYLPKDVSIKLNVTQPVALQNISTNAPGTEQLLGRWTGWKVQGSLHGFTESTIGILKEALQRNGVAVAEKADKRLKLCVDKATSIQGGMKFSATITVKVITGSGLTKEYHGLQQYGNGYATTSAFELAMGQCVEQMLKDQEILAYLEK